MAEESLRKKFQEQFEFLDGSNNIDTSIINHANFQQIITVLLQNMMNDLPNVAEKACIALYFLAHGCESSSPLTPFFKEIVQSLLDVTHREYAGLRICAYETLNEVVRTSTSTDEMASMVLLQLLPEIMMKLNNTILEFERKNLESDEREMLCGRLQVLDLEGKNLEYDEREKQVEIGMLCGCLHVLIQKLGSSESSSKHAFMQYADQIIGLLRRAFVCGVSGTIYERVMLAFGALANSMGPDFEKYMPDLQGYLVLALSYFKEYQVCAVTVGVVGDICRALEERFFPFGYSILGILIRNLSHSHLHRSVKPSFFSCIGQIALAIGEKFESYLKYTMIHLQFQLTQAAACIDDDEMTTEYKNSLRNGILDAYSGILQGLYQKKYGL